MAIVGALIIILNTYVISLFVRKKNLRKKSNLFLLNLTISDELIGLIVIPFITGQMRQGAKKVATWPVAQQYSHISYTFLTMCSLLCISNLFAIILDSCCHLCSPLRYQHKLTKAKAVTICRYYLGMLFGIRCEFFHLLLLNLRIQSERNGII